MEVFIYRTQDVKEDSFAALLEGANGPLRHLRFSEGPVVSLETVTDVVRASANARGSLETDAIFECIAQIRKRADLHPDAVVVLLSRM